MPLFGKKHIKQEAVPASAIKKIAVKDPVAKVQKVPKHVAEAEAKGHNKTLAVAAAKAAPIKGKKGEIIFPKDSVIKRPRVTEKAGMLSEKGIYTFEVQRTANTQQISQAIRAIYKVTPVKVSVAKIPSKAMFVRGKSGATTEGKKAYVYLKKGDTIEFI